MSEHRSRVGRVATLGASLLVVSLLIVGADPAGQARAPAQRNLSGEEIYRGACLPCHGPDGAGQTREVVGFEDEIPDFTDCSFASREAAADWVAVAHEGGPIRGFSPLMPAFGDALTDEELERTVDYIRDFCDEPRRWPKGELNFPRAFYTAKAFPEDEVVVAMSAATKGDHLILTKLIAETRVGARGQLEAILPFGFLEKPGGAWTGGVGDAVLATKWALLHSLRTGSILSAGLELIMPTGRDDRGLGKDTWILEPFIAFGQALPADAFIQLHLGSEVSTDPDKTGHEVFWRLATGMSFFQNSPFGRAWTPMVEVLGAMDIEDGATPNWDVVPQLQIPLPVRQHILLSVGARIPIDHFDSRPIVAVMYLLWDFYDGGLAEGW